MYPQQCAPWLLSPESMAIIVSVLQGEHLEAGTPAAPAMQQYLLQACARSLAEPEAVQGGATNELLALYEAAKHLAASGDYTCRPLANQVARDLGPLLQG